MRLKSHPWRSRARTGTRPSRATAATEIEKPRSPLHWFGIGFAGLPTLGTRRPRSDTLAAASDGAHRGAGARLGDQGSLAGAGAVGIVPRGVGEGTRSARCPACRAGTGTRSVTMPPSDPRADQRVPGTEDGGDRAGQREGERARGPIEMNQSKLETRPRSRRGHQPLLRGDPDDGAGTSPGR